MPAPSEVVREKWLQLLADPVHGLNPAFVHCCQKRQIAVPIPGDMGNPLIPFDFGRDSNNIFRMRESIDFLSRNSNQQYPCGIVWAKDAKQSSENRPKGSRFFGYVMVEALFYVAWLDTELPDNDDFETHLDALEEAVISVTNADTTKWVPVLYENLLDVADRMALEQTSETDVLLRRGIRFQLTALVAA